jgi:hypothetical protein
VRRSLGEGGSQKPKRTLPPIFAHRYSFDGNALKANASRNYQTGKLQDV